MSNKIGSFVLVCMTLLLVSCHADLNVHYKSGVTANNMWENESDATAAVYGTYRQFRATYATAYAFWGEYRTGLWGAGNDGSESYRDEIYLNKISASNSFCNWGQLYTTINDCNLILKYTPNIHFTDEDKKKQVLANAYYVRAFCYYWIARLWGDAPILLNGFESDKQDDLFPYRKPVTEVFQQVSDDINEALSLMPAKVKDRNMASSAAINMLKADFHLWMSKVNGKGREALLQAQTAIAAIKSDNDYSLQSEYASVFEKKLNSEIIFAWSFLRDECTGGYPDVFLEAIQNVTSSYHENPVKVGSVRQRCFYTQEYMEFMASDERDTRTKVSYSTYFDAEKKRNQQWINKFAGTWEDGTRIFDSDIIVYRYADVLLFSAEIENALGNSEGAIADLNEIAKRAYRVENYYSKSMSSQEIETKILEERMKEFAAEGKLWWDFIRMGVVFEKVPSLNGRENSKNVLLWPVANGSINSNPNITQTEFDD